MLSKKRKSNGLESQQKKFGYTFVIHYIIGIVVFFLYPLISSIIYSFSEITISPGKIITEWVALANFNEIINVDPNYLNNVRDSLGYIFYSLPIILAISLVLAVLLNQQFGGRTFVRMILFLPIILATSPIMLQLDTAYLRMPILSSAETAGGISYKTIIGELNLPGQVTTILTFLISKTADLIWNCGVQTILFLAGLQNIPASMYEVSKIEGANKWEEFWFITVPSIRHIISLVMIYTMIELFTASDNTVVSKAYSFLIAQDFGKGSAMLWFYFLIVIVTILVIYTAYQRLCVKRWE